MHVELSLGIPYSLECSSTRRRCSCCLLSSTLVMKTSVMYTKASLRPLSTCSMNLWKFDLQFTSQDKLKQIRMGQMCCDNFLRHVIRCYRKVVIRPYQIKLVGNSFIPQAVGGIVNMWDRVTVRYSCMIRCTTITTRDPVAVAFWDHLD